MADDNPKDRSSPSSNQFLDGRAGFPFVFLPTTFATGFNFSKNPTHDQATNESKEENEEEEAEAEVVETIDDDEVDHNVEKNDLRISQPKYSQLLKELDFSRTRMVDVTNLLTNEIDQQGNYFTPDENESPKKVSSDSSSSSSDDGLDNRKSKQKAEDTQNFAKAVDEIQNDLKHLTAVIEQASQISNNKKEDKSNEQQRKHTFDEDDDTSKQATQNYDLLDNEQEELPPSSKSSKIPRLITRQSKSIISSIDPDNQSTKQKDESNGEEQSSSPPAPRQQTLLSWESLFGVTDRQNTQPPNGLTSTQPILESHSTPKKEQVSSSSDEQLKPQINSSTKKNLQYQTYQTTSSSSDSDHSVHQVLHRPENKPASSPAAKQASPAAMQPQTLRQDSQATLIDENLDDLSSQIKQVLDHERQTVNTSMKEERTIDGLGSMSFPLSTPDVLSTDILDNDISNRPKDDLLRSFSNQRTDYHQQRPRNPTNIPERSSPQRKKPHQPHHHHHQKRYDGTNSRRTDDDWLTMLERLEQEHRTRLEKQQQQYEDYMHNLEEKMKRRFDDYLTLTNGVQESRLDNHDDTRPHHRSHPSIPIDSNIGRYKTHSHEHQYRTSAKDLISRYYPADSTLNILTTEKKHSNESNAVPREDHTHLRSELPGKHARHITDLKSYHDYEIDEFKGQLNRTKMGQSSSSARQSMETIERINNENIRLHDEVKELRHSLKITTDENLLLKRQVEELREQLNNKDVDLKNYHRTIADLEQQLTEAENTKEQQNEKTRHADRQIFFYQEDNERLKTELNLSRERLLRLEERFQEQENENETLRRQLFMIEADTNRFKNRLTDDHKLSSAMPLNVPTSRDYGRFALSSTTKNLSSPLNSPRETNTSTGRYQLNNNENLYRHTHSPRPMTRISDYLNDKPNYPQPYVSPTRHTFSPRKTSASRRRVEPMSNRSSIDRQSRNTEQLEQKLDQLLKKKRDLESRLSRIPLRGLTNTDRQLSDVLERELERVEQQLSSVKLELRKSNIYRPH